MHAKYSRDDYRNKTELHDLGFTEKMIESLLGDYDLTRPNPYYRSGAPIKLWSAKRVETVMESDAFRAETDKARPRRAAAAKAVETKRRKATELLERFKATIVIERPEGYTFDQLIRDGVEHWNSRNVGCVDKASGRYITPLSPEDVDSATRVRWAVNYIRHCLTSYNSTVTGYGVLIDQSAGMVGRNALCHEFRCEVLDRIAKEYPKVAGECARQKDSIYTGHHVFTEEEIDQLTGRRRAKSRP